MVAYFCIGVLCITVFDKKNYKILFQTQVVGASEGMEAHIHDCTSKHQPKNLASFRLKLRMHNCKWVFISLLGESFIACNSITKLWNSTSHSPAYPNNQEKIIFSFRRLRQWRWASNKLDCHTCSLQWRPLNESHDLQEVFELMDELVPITKRRSKLMGLWNIAASKPP